MGDNRTIGEMILDEVRAGGRTASQLAAHLRGKAHPTNVQMTLDEMVRQGMVVRGDDGWYKLGQPATFDPPGGAASADALLAAYEAAALAAARASMEIAKYERLRAQAERAYSEAKQRRDDLKRRLAEVE